MKICSKCKEPKSLDAFYPRNNVCKVCWSQRVKEKNRLNPEENRERVLKWQKEHPNKVNRKNRLWKRRNKEAVAKTQRKYRKKYPKKDREIQIRRRARKLEAKGSFKAEDIERMIELQDGKCLKCGKKRKLTVDHVVPLSHQGWNSLENLQLLCQSCNSSKGTNVIDYRSKALKRKIFEQGDLFK